MENKEKNTFEGALDNLEKIVKELEAGNVDLDNAINKYSEAMELAKFCSEKLKDATDKVNKILMDNGELKDFNVEETN